MRSEPAPHGTPNAAELDAELTRILDFAQASLTAQGAAWLTSDGQPDLERPVFTWLTARAAHVFSLATLRGYPGAEDMVDGFVAALRGRLQDRVHGGWHHGVTADRDPLGPKSCYDHAFVVLAAASATAAGRPHARVLLQEGLDGLARFRTDDSCMFADEWDPAWTCLDPYRGLNANMHSVEALLAASDVLGDPHLLNQCLEICDRVRGWAEAYDGRIPEHFTDAWEPILDYNSDHPADPFKPYGATVGHGFEWSRLLVQLSVMLDRAGRAPEWLLSTACVLFDRATQDGWHRLGRPGFVYTTDWNGIPVVSETMHWVAAEAVCAASVLARVTGDRRYLQLESEWWSFIYGRLRDTELGSWHHELDPGGRVSETVWVGKPDAYHAVQATLIPLIPISGGIAQAVALDARGR